MLNTNFSEAVNSDDLNKTIDYCDVNKIITEEMAIRSKLIEHVGQRIVNRLKAEITNIDHIKLKLTKICPPINGDVQNVAIIIEED